MAKITLSPNDITALIKSHPEVEIDLIDRASAQVADAISRRVTRELVEKRVGELMESLLTEQVGWNQRSLAPGLQAMVESSVRSASEQLFQEKTGQKVMELVRTEARRQMETSARDLAATMKTEIRSMIREEIRGMLMGKE
jgi:hypothetical protein